MYSDSLRVSRTSGIQRRFTKRLYGLKCLSHADRLSKLGTLQFGAEAITSGPDFMLQNSFFGTVNVSFNVFFSFGTLSKTRGHVYKLYKPQTTKTAPKNFFAEIVINVWNSLPPVADFSSLACFKHTIINVDFTEFLKC